LATCTSIMSASFTLLASVRIRPGATTTPRPVPLRTPDFFHGDV